jgi:mannose-1-phosphate guanylyltransferase / phosphomannomutase
VNDVVGIGLVGGRGLRARPLTLEASGYLRSKATMCFVGRPIIEWQVLALRDQGIADFYVLANGRENRYQVRDALGYGEALDTRIQYSRPRMDRHNTGSGEATLSGIAHWNLAGVALVFPTDSLFEFDFDELVRRHRAAGALVTVATVDRTCEEVAGKYGVIVADRDGRIRRFVEKPHLSTARKLAADPDRVPINAGMYVVDCTGLRTLAGRPALRALAHRALDWGNDLLPWLVARGYPVHAQRIAKVSDVGNPKDYLRALTEVLKGEYPLMLKRMPPPYAGNIWIHESSLRRADRASGLTLEAKLAEGMVRLGPNVYIGRDVEIEPGVCIADASIGDGVDLHAGCELRRVACLDGAVIGPGAKVSDTHIGVMARVDSTPTAATVVERFSALGNEVTVAAGARLAGVTVYPRLNVPWQVPLPAGAAVTCAADVLRWA